MTKDVSEPRVYSYLRLSSAEQLKGDGARRQQQGFDDWYQREGAGMPIDAELTLVDFGVSAFRGDNVANGALAAFLKAVEAGHVPKGSILAIEALDRLSRQGVYDSAYLMIGILRCGVDIVTFGEGGMRFRHDADPQSQLVNLVIAITFLARGNNESVVKSDRVGKAWAKKRTVAQTESKPMTHLVPGWLKLEQGRVVVVHEHVPVVREIFERTAAGDGAGVIARDFNVRGVLPFGRPGRDGRIIKVGKGWHDSYVKKILANRAVIGEFQPGIKPKGCSWAPAGEPIPDYFPRVISDDLWHRAHAAKSERHRTGGRREAFRSLFRGMTFCAVCGSGMTYEDKGNRSSGPKLVCESARSKIACDHTLRYDYTRLEVAVLVMIGQKAKELFYAESEAISSVENEVKAIESRLERLTSGRSRLIESIEREQNSDARRAYAGRISEISFEISLAEGELKAKASLLKAVPKEAISDKLSDLHASLRQTETVDQRRSLNRRLKRLISRIEFCPRQGGGEITASFIGGGTAKYFTVAKRKRG